MPRPQLPRQATPCAPWRSPPSALVLLVLLLGSSIPSASSQTRPSRPLPPGGDGVPDEHLDIRPDGSYGFLYDTRDATRIRHVAKAGAGGSPVQGEYRERDSAAPHRDRVTQYTAGANGFRAKGPHIARRMSLSQVPLPYAPPVRPDSPAYQPSYDGYHDPNNDPTYDFGFKTGQHARREHSNNVGTVNGAYEYRDDVGELHRVQYTAGKDTGFIVHNEVPDARASIGPLFAQAPGPVGKRARGRSAVRVRPDGSYDFTAAGPNLRHQEVSNAQGFRRGSYSYVDDRGVQRTVEYEAGPNIGFKVINTRKGPASFPHISPTYYPSLFPSPGTTVRPLPGVDDLFVFPEGINTAESGPAVKPPKKPHRPTSDESIENISFGDEDLFPGGGGGAGGGSSGPGSGSSGGAGVGGSGGKKPGSGGSGGGGGGSSGSSGGTSSGPGSGTSGSGEDFLVNLGENYDKGPRPTGGYGSGGSGGSGSSGGDSGTGNVFSTLDVVRPTGGGPQKGATWRPGGSGFLEEDELFGTTPPGAGAQGLLGSLPNGPGGQGGFKPGGAVTPASDSDLFGPASAGRPGTVGTTDADLFGSLPGSLEGGGSNTGGGSFGSGSDFLTPYDPNLFNPSSTHAPPFGEYSPDFGGAYYPDYGDYRPDNRPNYRPGYRPGPRPSGRPDGRPGVRPGYGNGPPFNYRPGNRPHPGDDVFDSPPRRPWRPQGERPNYDDDVFVEQFKLPSRPYRPGGSAQEDLFGPQSGRPSRPEDVYGEYDYDYDYRDHPQSSIPKPPQDVDLFGYPEHYPKPDNDLYDYPNRDPLDFRPPQRPRPHRPRPGRPQTGTYYENDDYFPGGNLNSGYYNSDNGYYSTYNGNRRPPGSRPSRPNPNEDIFEHFEQVSRPGNGFQKPGEDVFGGGSYRPARPDDLVFLRPSSRPSGAYTRPPPSQRPYAGHPVINRPGVSTTISKPDNADIFGPETIDAERPSIDADIFGPPNPLSHPPLRPSADKDRYSLSNPLSRPIGFGPSADKDLSGQSKPFTSRPPSVGTDIFGGSSVEMGEGFQDDDLFGGPIPTGVGATPAGTPQQTDTLLTPGRPSTVDSDLFGRPRPSSENTFVPGRPASGVTRQPSVPGQISGSNFDIFESDGVADIDDEEFFGRPGNGEKPPGTFSKPSPDVGLFGNSRPNPGYSPVKHNSDFLGTSTSSNAPTTFSGFRPPDAEVFDTNLGPNSRPGSGFSKPSDSDLFDTPSTEIEGIHIPKPTKTALDSDLFGDAPVSATRPVSVPNKPSREPISASSALKPTVPSFMGSSSFTTGNPGTEPVKQTYEEQFQKYHNDGSKEADDIFGNVESVGTRSPDSKKPSGTFQSSRPMAVGQFPSNSESSFLDASNSEDKDERDLSFLFPKPPNGVTVSSRPGGGGGGNSGGGGGSFLDQLRDTDRLNQGPAFRSGGGRYFQPSRTPSFSGTLSNPFRDSRRFGNIVGGAGRGVTETDRGGSKGRASDLYSGRSVEGGATFPELPSAAIKSNPYQIYGTESQLVAPDIYLAFARFNLKRDEPRDWRS